MRISFESCTTDDFLSLAGRAPSTRARAITARLEGRPVGIGGFVYQEDGTIWASMLATPEVRRYPTAVYRGAKMAMRLAARLRLRRIFALADPTEPAAERFLERLGFRPTTWNANGKLIYLWERGGDD